MSQGSRSSRGTTIREGTGEKNWYLIAAYVATSILSIGFIGWAMYKAGSLGGASAILVAVFGLPIFALATYPALFKDSSYLRGTAAGWAPKWWLYIGVPIAATVLAYVAGEAAGIEVGSTVISGGVFSLFVFPAATAISDGYYLYQRHQHIGVP